MAAQGGLAQENSAGTTPDSTRKVLVEKARALDARGRPDMAIQLWQQILLSDPNNVDALAGLATDYKMAGLSDKANDVLERLRHVNPNDPNIGKIAQMTSTRAQSDSLRQAGELARQGKPDAAMQIYRELYGERPPDGDIALAYYQTLYATKTGKATAIAAMRALAQRNPSDTRFIVELGVMLTYDAATRAEGIRILSAHSKEVNAQAALRQALIWDAANPASAAQLREFLKEHPGDTEIASHLKENEAKLAQMNSGIARTPAERAAFAALNAHRLEDAEARFQAILTVEPDNGRVHAGMGFLRMQQNNFAGAISFLNQAEEDGYKTGVVEDALTTSRFWYTMGEATQALDENQLVVAMEKYRAALAMRPQSPEALNGIAGLYVKQQEYPASASIYEQLIKIQPGAAGNWRGLFLAYAQDNQAQKALELSAHFPAGIKAALAQDPEYLRVLASAYQALNRPDDARRTLNQALALPYPEGGGNLKADARMQYAGILMEANRFDQAAALYQQIVNDDQGNVPAWMGLISAHHELGHDRQAIADVGNMPPASYEAALTDTGFLSMLGAMYQQANQFDVAQGLLERAVKLKVAAGGQPSIPLLLQLAAIYLQRNNTAQAFDLYHQVLVDHPERADAWKGLIATLQSTNRNAEALQEIAQIPAAVRKQLEIDIDFVQSEASIYAATGDTARAVEAMNRVRAHYNGLKMLPPANVEVQNAWLLYNTKNDRALYVALMHLGGRKDLTAAQIETVQTIWASWSVRRAGVAIDNGNPARAVEILEAAALAFPDNLAVRKAVAGGYVLAGRAKDSVTIYKSVPMQDASAVDFRGAIGAALAANDRVQAELWLRQGLDRFPRDAEILQLAARFEQARGDNQRAAEYYRASLAAMPQTTPVDRLAHDLVYPDSDNKVHRAGSPAELQRLLDPNEEPFAKTSKLPPLPAYGADPYGGSAPVVLSQPPQSAAHQTVAPGQEQGQWIAPPDSMVAPSVTPSREGTLPPLQGLSPQSGTQNGNRTNSPNRFMGSMHLPASQQSISAPAQANQQRSQQGRAGSAPSGLVEQSSNGSGQYRQMGNSNQYSGRVQLSPAEENVDSTESALQPTQAAPLWNSTTNDLPRGSNPGAGMRITSEPMDVIAARAQALFAEQTDAQVSQGSVANLKPGVTRPQTAAGFSTYSPKPRTDHATGQYNVAQYTPSAQEAATGAYSAPKQQTATPAQSGTLPQPGEANTQPAAKPRKKSAAKPLGAAGHPARPAAQTAPPLSSAPAEATPQQQIQMSELPGEPVPNAAQSSATNGLSDQELEDRNLPPLRGPWVRVQREKRPPSPRDQAEAALESIQSGYSAWMGGAGLINYRAGNLGYDHLAALEAPFEASTPLGYSGRLVVVARPVFLDSGQADGTALLNVVQQPTTGAKLISIPEPIGTLTATDTVIPGQQNAAGIGGEVQLIFKTFGIAGGITPYNFLIWTETGRLYFKPGNGPFTFNLSRDSVKDTQLSYAGLRDPAGNTLGNLGQIWGGVVADQGNVQYTHGDAQSGFYLGGGGQYLSGYQVQVNQRIDGSGGAYWRLMSSPENGTLSVGANFFGMHYTHNEGAFTHGMGGYFSPQAYFLANAPVTWTGHVGTAWHYNILGSLGVQAFQEEQTPLWPLAVDKPLEISFNNAALPAKTSVGPNYDLHAQMAYQVSPHWFVGGTLSANNARNYSFVTAGFTIRYLFRSQPSTANGPTGLFPTDGVRPFMVP
jgi:tetratricopeptide (TPR) repeat protein